MAKRLLFVDDDANLLAGLRRMLRPMRREWQATFCGSGPEALAEMARQPFDVVVSDMRMPGMDGAHLLRQVRELYPGTARLVLSGQADRDAILAGVGPIHQYLAKPCNPDTLIATLNRVCALDEWLPDELLRQRICRLESLPGQPRLVRAVADRLTAGGNSLADVGRLVAQDAGLSLKVLQLVSSAFLGPKAAPTLPHPAQAVTLLGQDAIKTVALTGHAFVPFNADHPSGFPFDDFWRHSRAVAWNASLLVKSAGGSRAEVDAAYAAGLLHDVGKLALALARPEEMAAMQRAVARQQLPPAEAEQSVFGRLIHPQVGAYLLGLWGLPPAVVAAVGHHHQPPDSGGMDCHAAVVTANRLAHNGSAPEHGNPPELETLLIHPESTRYEHQNSVC
ncbi:MAG: response regulator [Anaerolineae bacterium]